MTKLHELAELGQAIWLDYIRRSFIASGGLGKLIDIHHLRARHRRQR